MNTEHGRYRTLEKGQEIWEKNREKKGTRGKETEKERGGKSTNQLSRQRNKNV